MPSSRCEVGLTLCGHKGEECRKAKLSLFDSSLKSYSRHLGSKICVSHEFSFTTVTDRWRTDT